jgi:hypothetical protein
MNNVCYSIFNISTLFFSPHGILGVQYQYFAECGWKMSNLLQNPGGSMDNIDVVKKDTWKTLACRTFFWLCNYALDYFWKRNLRKTELQCTWVTQDVSLVPTVGILSMFYSHYLDFMADWSSGGLTLTPASFPFRDLHLNNVMTSLWHFQLLENALCWIFSQRGRDPSKWQKSEKFIESLIIGYPWRVN